MTNTPSTYTTILPLVGTEMDRLRLMPDHRHDQMLIPTYPVDFSLGEGQDTLSMETYLQTSGEYMSLSPTEKVAIILEKSVGKDTLNGMSGDDLEYHIPYWTQALIRNPHTRLRLDNAKQILYPVQPDVTLPLTKIDSVDAVLSRFSDRVLWSLFVRNFDEIQKLFLEKKEAAIDMLRHTHLQVLSNHTSWLNLPLIAHCLHRFWGIPKEDIYILLGPALTTQELGYAGAIKHANLIKTIPDTKNADIGYTGTRQLRVGTLKKILEIFGNDDSGKILLISPSGTTDRYNPQSGGFEIVEPSLGTIGLLKRLEGVPSMIIGSNDRAIFPGNSRLVPRQRAEMRLGPISFNSANWQHLPDYVVNKAGRRVAIWNNSST